MPPRQLRKLAERFDRLATRIGPAIADARPHERRVHLGFLLGESTELFQVARFDPELQEVARELADRDVLAVEIRGSVLTMLADDAEVLQRLHLPDIQAGRAGEIAFGEVRVGRGLGEVDVGFFFRDLVARSRGRLRCRGRDDRDRRGRGRLLRCDRPRVERCEPLADDLQREE